MNQSASPARRSRAKTTPIATSPVSNSKTAAAKPKEVKPKVAREVKPKVEKAPKEVKPKAEKSKEPKEVKPKATKPKVEKAPKEVKRTVVRRITAAPMSPRTATTRLVNPDPMCFSDVRNMTNGIAKSVTRLAQLALAVGANGEFTTQDGENIVRSDINTLVHRLGRAVRAIPTAARRSNRRNRVQLTDDERAERIAALNSKASAGMNALGMFIKNKAVINLLLNNELKSISENDFPPKPDAGDPISAAFYISDPLREFFHGANLGNGIALFYPGRCSDETRAINGSSNPKAAVEAVERDIGHNPIDDLGGKAAEVYKFADPCHIIAPLVIDRGIATSPLLMTLMAMYISANGLKAADSRITVDDRMRKFFDSGNTRWVVNGFDLTKAAQSAGIEIPADSDLSGLARLLERAPKRDGAPAPYDGTTFTRAMSITLASYYRVRWVTTELANNLTKGCVRDLAYAVKSYL